MAKKKGGIFGFVDRLEGDKIVWMIALILIMVSILAISSSTPLLAIMDKTTRPAIIKEQLGIVLLGLLFIIGIYNIRKVKWLSYFSRVCFLLSFGALTFLVLKIKIPGIRAVEINGAVRVINFFGFQIHVYEFVKVFMVLYLSWAIEAFNEGKLWIISFLSRVFPQSAKYLKKDIWQKIICIYFPMLLVCAMVAVGSNSSALFVGLTMFITILVGGIKVKELLPVFLAALIVGAIAVFTFFATDGRQFKRVGTGISRVTTFIKGEEQSLSSLDPKSIEFQEEVDRLQQPSSAKVAISQGGIIGKGPGRSTQRYVVPIMFEDFMFSFLVEEYGWLGGVIVMLLYVGLLARGALIVKHCNSLFAKSALAGLIILISGQAMMHIMINVGLLPTTGQTLPMISHGNSSFLAFSISFGIILSFSRIAKKNLEKEIAGAEPIIQNKEENQ